MPKKTKKVNQRKIQREFIESISYFYKEQEQTGKLLFSISKVVHNKQDKILEIGLTASERLGTILEKLRKLKKELSNYLFEVGLTNVRQTKIVFFVDNEEEKLKKINNLIEKIQKNEL